MPAGIAFATYAKDVLGVSDLNVLSIQDMQSNVFKLPVTPFSYADVPLLWYFAHESIIEQQGQVLGKLGSRLNAEVLYGRVEASPVSIFSAGSSWTSALSGRVNDITFLDVLDFIGWTNYDIEAGQAPNCLYTDFAARPQNLLACDDFDEWYVRAANYFGSTQSLANGTLTGSLKENQLVVQGNNILKITGKGIGNNSYRNQFTSKKDAQAFADFIKPLLSEFPKGLQGCCL